MHVLRTLARGKQRRHKCGFPDLAKPASQPYHTSGRPTDRRGVTLVRCYQCRSRQCTFHAHPLSLSPSKTLLCGADRSHAGHIRGKGGAGIKKKPRRTREKERRKRNVECAPLKKKGSTWSDGRFSYRVVCSREFEPVQLGSGYE